MKMATWRLRWNFSQETYQPGSDGIVSSYLENLGDIPIFVSDIGIQFDWMKDKYYHSTLDENYGKVIQPHSTRFITTLNFNIPQTIAGQVLYKVCYHLYEYNRSVDQWHDLGESWSDEKYFMNVFPLPYYRAFITRSLRPEDRIIGDELERVIKEWGFTTKTVKFKERVSDVVLRESIRGGILNSDCHIAVATPRYLDALSGVWRTFSYLHNEVGIAFGQEYPILILLDKRVAIDGLPSTLREYTFEFDINNYEEIRRRIGATMSAFREYIANKKWQEFTNTLAKIAVSTGLVIAGGIAGALLGSSKK